MRTKRAIFVVSALIVAGLLTVIQAQYSPPSGGGGSGSATPAGIQANQYTILTIAGSTPAYTATASPTLSTAYTDGMVFWVKAATMTCDGNTNITLNIDGKGAKRLYAADLDENTDAPLQAACGYPGDSSWIQVAYRQSADAFAIVNFQSGTYAAYAWSVFPFGCTDYTFAVCTALANVGLSNTWVGANNFTGGSITVPTRSQSDSSANAANTSYVDTAVANGIAGVNPAVAVAAATTAVLPAVTYSNGASGIGATLTQNSAAALTVDGYTVLLADRLLIKTQASPAQNGIYTVTTLGTALIPFVLTRALDFDTPSNMNSTGAIPVVNGTVNGTTQWVLTSKITTVGTDAVTFTKFSSSPSSVPTVAAPYITVSGSLYGPVYAMTGPAAAATWTWVNQSTATATDVNGSLVIAAPIAAGDDFRLLVKSAPSTPWTVTAFIQANNFPIAAGLAWRQSSDGKFIICGNGSASSIPSMSVLKYTNPTSFSASYVQANYLLQPQSGMWLQITDDGTNRKCSTSIDGVTSWQTLSSVGRTDFLTANQYGVFINVSSSLISGQLNLLSLAVQ